jgi:hypothetical protein
MHWMLSVPKTHNDVIDRDCVCLQDLKTLVVESLNPLSPEVISRQATINIGKPDRSLTQLQHTAAESSQHRVCQTSGSSNMHSAEQKSSAQQGARASLSSAAEEQHRAATHSIE